MFFDFTFTNPYLTPTGRNSAVYNIVARTLVPREITHRDRVTTVVWCDGSRTEVSRMEGAEDSDVAAFVYALAKHLYGSIRVVDHMLDKLDKTRVQAARERQSEEEERKRMEETERIERRHRKNCEKRARHHARKPTNSLASSPLDCAQHASLGAFPTEDLLEELEKRIRMY